LKSFNPNLKAKLGLAKECWVAEQDICDQINEYKGDSYLESME